MTTVFFDGTTLYSDTQYTSPAYKEKNFKHGFVTKIVTDLPASLHHKKSRVLAAAAIGSVGVVERVITGSRAFCENVGNPANLTSYIDMMKDTYIGSPHQANVVFLVRDPDERCRVVDLALGVGNSPEVTEYKHGEVKQWGSGSAYVKPFLEIKEFTAVERIAIAASFDQYSGGKINMYDPDIEEVVTTPELSEERKLEITNIMAKHCFGYMSNKCIEEREAKRAKMRKDAELRRKAVADKEAAQKKEQQAKQKPATKKAAPVKKPVRRTVQPTA